MTTTDRTEYLTDFDRLVLVHTHPAERLDLGGIKGCQPWSGESMGWALKRLADAGLVDLDTSELYRWTAVRTAAGSAYLESLWRDGGYPS